MSSLRWAALSSERMPWEAERSATVTPSVVGRASANRTRAELRVNRPGCVCRARRWERPRFMRIVVTGATGNVGTSVVAALARDERVTEIVGLARRRPAWADTARTRWVMADITSAPLEELFAGADAVVHLAWLIQPSRDER